MNSYKTEEGVCRVKENLILKNFLEKLRRDKAKVLRLQQVNEYEECLLDDPIGRTLARRGRSRNTHVTFSPASLIQDAIKEGNKYEVLDFLSKGVSVDFNQTQGEGMTLLHQACVYDDYIIAQALIKKGALLDLQDDYGCTPLHICCMWDSLKCAQLLVSNSANANILDVDGNFAVDLASENSHLKAMMKKHMQQKLKIDESQLNSLRNKPQKRMLQDIRELLESGSSVDTASSHGISLLHIAVTNGYVSAARMLLENSANVNAADRQMWTPLHCAAKYGQVKMTRLLLSHYANPHSRTTSGFTPRELAKNPEIATMLVHAEDTFLDLDQQKTPSKPKRFSASLLDQDDDELNLVRVASRTITAAKVSKRVIMKENDIISQMADELKQELKSEMQFCPPDVTNSETSLPTWQQMIPPPVPPRDDPPPIPSPPHPIVKPKTLYTANKASGDAYIDAVVTIQRAYRRRLKLIRPPLLEVAMQTLEDYGNSFYEEMVFQNAEDIARESDRQRSLKSLQRKSWSNDLRRSVRSITSSRPLSTGTLMMQMPDAADEAAVWLPQNAAHGKYPPRSMPPDLIPQHTPGKDYWSSVASHKGKPRRSIKQGSMGSTDSGVSLGSVAKDQIELTKTVKHSLTVSENPDMVAPPTPSSINRKASLSSHRMVTQPTYRMPPLTPTVASLIHTAAVTKKQESPTRAGLKVMKPVTTTASNVDENAYLIADGPDGLRFKSHTTREHRYGSLMSNRGSILRDARFQSLHQAEASQANRHSWNGEVEEGSTSFGRTRSQTVHPIVSPPASSEWKTFSEGVDSASPVPSESTASENPNRRNSRQGNKGPPPLPRRAPTTKLSNSNGSYRPHIRSESLGSFNTELTSFMENNQSPRGVQGNSPDDELPIVPPALPLYTPHALTPKQSGGTTPSSGNDLPAPPPPDMLLYDTLKNMGVCPHPVEQSVYDFPPPPPTL